MKVQWDGEYMEPPIDFPKNGTFAKPYNLRFLYHNARGSVGIIEKSFSSFLLTSMTPTPEKKSALKNSSIETEKNLMTSTPVVVKNTKPQEIKKTSKAKKQSLFLTFFFL